MEAKFNGVRNTEPARLNVVDWKLLFRNWEKRLRSERLGLFQNLTGKRLPRCCSIHQTQECKSFLLLLDAGFSSATSGWFLLVKWSFVRHSLLWQRERRGLQTGSAPGPSAGPSCVQWSGAGNAIHLHIWSIDLVR